MAEVCSCCTRVEERLDALDRRWERNNVLLEQHIKRTEMLEARLEPVETSVRGVKSLFKILVWFLGAGGLTALLAKFFAG